MFFFYEDRFLLSSKVRIISNQSLKREITIIAYCQIFRFFIVEMMLKAQKEVKLESIPKLKSFQLFPTVSSGRCIILFRFEGSEICQPRRKPLFIRCQFLKINNSLHSHSFCQIDEIQILFKVFGPLFNHLLIPVKFGVFPKAQMAEVHYMVEHKKPRNIK